MAKLLLALMLIQSLYLAAPSPPQQVACALCDPAGVHRG
jgi:hypothetical protein